MRSGLPRFSLAVSVIAELKYPLMESRSCIVIGSNLPLKDASIRVQTFPQVKSEASLDMTKDYLADLLKPSSKGIH